jgi:predicted Zn-ribbon and HTH transcriptional regulator
MVTEIQSQVCEECGAEFTILHGEIDEPSFCPFCKADLDLEEEIDDWDDEEEEDI